MITPNPYIVITPKSFEVDEYVDFTQDISIVWEPPAPTVPAPVIPETPPEPYTWVLHDVILLGDIRASVVKASRTGDMSFTIAGVFKDVFDRSIKYVNKDNTKGEVTNFSLLPDTYGAVYSYTPTSQTQFIVKYTVRMRDPQAIISALKDEDFDTYTGSIIVRNNWQISNKYFQDSIAKGGFNIQAAANGLS